jgi:hypothetical protein
MADMNPYKAPESPVADVFATGGGDAVSVAAGNGWQWITEGFALFRKQPGLWIGIIIVWFIMMALLSIIPFIGGLATMFLTPVFLGGIMLGCKALDRDEPLTFNHLFAGFSTNTSNLIMIGVLELAALVVVFLIVGVIMGFSLLPALLGGGRGATAASMSGLLLAALVMLALMIPVYMAVWFAPALVVFRNLSAMEAMKASFAACLKNIVPFLVYGVIAFVLAIGASIPAMLGWLVLGPTLVAAIYTAYKDIFQE